MNHFQATIAAIKPLLDAIPTDGSDPYPHIAIIADALEEEGFTAVAKHLRNKRPAFEKGHRRWREEWGWHYLTTNLDYAFGPRIGESPNKISVAAGLNRQIRNAVEVFLAECNVPDFVKHDHGRFARCNS